MELFLKGDFKMKIHNILLIVLVISQFMLYSCKAENYRLYPEFQSINDSFYFYQKDIGEENIINSYNNTSEEFKPSEIETPLYNREFDPLFSIPLSFQIVDAVIINRNVSFFEIIEIFDYSSRNISVNFSINLTSLIYYELFSTARSYSSDEFFIYAITLLVRSNSDNLFYYEGSQELFPEEFNNIIVSVSEEENIILSSNIIFIYLYFYYSLTITFESLEEGKNYGVTGTFYEDNIDFSSFVMLSENFDLADENFKEIYYFALEELPSELAQNQLFTVNINNITNYLPNCQIGWYNTQTLETIKSEVFFQNPNNISLISPSTNGLYQLTLIFEDINGNKYIYTSHIISINYNNPSYNSLQDQLLTIGLFAVIMIILIIFFQKKFL